MRIDNTADCPLSKVTPPSLCCELPKLISEMKLELGSATWTSLAVVLPVFVIFNSNTLDLPRTILVFIDGGSTDNLGRMGSIRTFTVIHNNGPSVVFIIKKNCPLSGFIAVSLKSISTVSPGCNVVLDGAPFRNISTLRYPASDSIGVAVSPVRVAGPSLCTTVMLWNISSNAATASPFNEIVRGVDLIPKNPHCT